MAEREPDSRIPSEEAHETMMRIVLGDEKWKELNAMTIEERWAAGHLIFVSTASLESRR